MCRAAHSKAARLISMPRPMPCPPWRLWAASPKGSTTLTNVAQARVKETDRITVMAQELAKMGARITEQPDGLVIDAAPLTGTNVHGHHDHRVVMALAIAALGATGTTTIDTAEAVAVTYPTFVESMQQLGARIKIV